MISSDYPHSFSQFPPLKELETSHTVVHTRGPSDGRFTFTSHDAGDHSICLSTNYSSWFSNTHLRMYLDIVVGSAKPDIEHDRSHISDLAAKVRDLNQKLEDIRREQQYQREREADFRNLSEATNARAVWYSVAQIIVLVGTCIWQLRYLKVSWSMSFVPKRISDGLCSSGFLKTERCDNHSDYLPTLKLLRRHRVLNFQEDFFTISSLCRLSDCISYDTSRLTIR